MSSMGIIKANKLVHEFFRRDEDGNVESITTALDQVDLEVKEGQFIAILGHNGQAYQCIAFSYGWNFVGGRHGCVGGG